MIAQHNNRWNSQAHENVEQRLHLVRLTIIREVAREQENVRITAHSFKLIFQLGIALRIEVQIGGGSDSHADRRFASCGVGAGVARAFAERFSSLSRRRRVSSRRFSRAHSFTSIANIFSSTRLPRNFAFESGLAI